MDRRTFLRTSALVAGGAIAGGVAVEALNGGPGTGSTALGRDRANLTGSGLNTPRVFSRVQTGDLSVALTLDDGPAAASTAAVLKLLKQHGVTATFDVVGNRVQSSTTELLRQMGREGHEIGNHTWSHRVLAGLPIADIDPELRKTDELIAAVTGNRPRYVRPPGGEVTPELLTVASGFGYDVVLWSVQLHAPAESPTADPVKYVLDNLQPGAIILAHDLGDLSGTGASDALPRLIKGVVDKGYRFLTISALVAAGTPVQSDAI